MDLKLHDTRVIVTGGGAGIGRAIVDGFLAEGAAVAVCDIDADALGRLPDGVFHRRVDVGIAEDLAAFIEDAIAHLGGLDCLVNNAGIAGPSAGIEAIDLADWNRTLAICLTSQFVCASRAVEALRRSANASIVNLSSVAGRVGFPQRTPYAAAKWGVVGLTKSLSIELGPDRIRVNAIMPGLVAGDRQRRVLEARAQNRGRSFAEVEAEAFSLTSIAEYVTPEQIADQVLFLASERGRTISGQAISVCGDTRALA
ncbi:SDR family oxidoreductase [Jannaschia rubra]|uniref:2,5-dichloro-2,5-cyclohexadiene-1,4-diol dehydrogenase n=1 Tax=Jannaschia rubra TaxID=282197 RepID=A0A0M6XWD8_9RHOB|nr:SDR family oxidoreductase [Jannaschia rubra]CTQ34591.1 2,5-dichloro-2,5-cyclohexadiene-1,4-diol dehydrogenase [Jannaschia rubra]SFG72430.1 NAD(P)-dependent dehydrogenase, short-chain alcohol dehydrogenase family [Jannaschia rubra]